MANQEVQNLRGVSATGGTYGNRFGIPRVGNKSIAQLIELARQGYDVPLSEGARVLAKSPKGDVTQYNKWVADKAAQQQSQLQKINAAAQKRQVNRLAGGQGVWDEKRGAYVGGGYDTRNAPRDEERRLKLESTMNQAQKDLMAKSGKYYTEEMREQSMMSPAMKIIEQNNIQNYVQAGQHVTWKMAELVERNIASPEDYGKFSQYMAEWLKLEGIDKIEYFENIETGLNAIAHNDIMPSPLSKIVQIGALRVGDVLDKSQAAEYSYDIPEGSKITIIKDPTTGEIVAKLDYYNADGTINQSKSTEFLSGGKVDENGILIGGDKYRVRNFATPQILTPAEAATYFTSEESKAYLSALPDGTMVVAGNAIVKRINGEDVSTFTKQEDGTYVSPTGVRYTQDDVDNAEGQMETTILYTTIGDYEYHTDGTVIDTKQGITYSKDEWDTQIKTWEDTTAAQAELFKGRITPDLYKQVLNDSKEVEQKSDGTFYVKNVVGINRQYDISTYEGFTKFVEQEPDTFMRILLDEGDTKATRDYLTASGWVVGDGQPDYARIKDFFDYGKNGYTETVFGLANLDMSDLALAGASNPLIDLYNSVNVSGVGFDSNEREAIKNYIGVGYSLEYCIKNLAMITSAYKTYRHEQQIGSMKTGAFPDVEKGSTFVGVGGREVTIEPYKKELIFGYPGTISTFPEFKTLNEFAEYLQTEDGVKSLRDIGCTPASVQFLQMLGLDEKQVIEFYTESEWGGGTPVWVDRFIIKPLEYSGIPTIIDMGADMAKVPFQTLNAYVFDSNSVDSLAFKQGLSKVMADEYKGNKFLFTVGYMSGQDLNISELVDAYAPGWVGTAGEFLNPVYMVPLGGAARFIGLTGLLEKAGMGGISKIVFGKAEKELANPVLRVSRQFLPKRFDTFEKLQSFGERMGLRIKKLPEGGYWVEAQDVHIKARNLDEIHNWLQYGNKEGIDTGINYLRNMRNIKTLEIQNGKPTGRLISIYDTAMVTDIFQTKAGLRLNRWFDKVKDSPFYKPDDYDALMASISDCERRGIIKPRDIANFAKQVQIISNQAGDEVSRRYISRINNLTKVRVRGVYKNVMDTLGWNKGDFTDGIIGLRQDCPQDVIDKLYRGRGVIDGVYHEGTLTTAANDVAQYHKYYVFEHDQQVHDWFDNTYQLIDGIGELARMHGKEFGRITFEDTLGLAHYFPRHVTGAQGIETLNSIANNFDTRVVEMAKDCLDAGFYYDTLENTLASYIKGVYRYIGREDAKNILASIGWTGIPGSETLRGMILIHTDDEAKAYLEKADVLVKYLTGIKNGTLNLKGQYITWFKRNFPKHLTEIQDILNEYEVVTNIGKLDELILRVQKGGKLISKDKAWLKKSGFDYTAFNKVFTTRKGWQKAEILRVLESRKAVLKAVDDYLRFPDIPEVIESQVAISEKRLAAIREMKALTERVLRGERIEGSLKKELDRISRHNLPVYREPYPQLRKALEDYDRIRNAKSNLPEMNQLLDEFIDREFSGLKDVKAELSKEAKTNLDELIQRAKDGKVEAAKWRVISHKERTAYLKGEREPGVLDATSKARMFQGLIFKPQQIGKELWSGDRIVAAVDKEFAPHIEKWLSVVNDVGQLPKTLITSVDLSAPLTFGQLLIGLTLRDLSKIIELKPPTAFLKAFGIPILGMIEPRMIEMVYRTSNWKWYEKYIPLGLKTGGDMNEFYKGLGVMEKLEGKNPFADFTIEKITFPYRRANIAFSGFMEIAQVEIIKSMEGAWLRQGGTRMQLVEFAQLCTGTRPSLLTTTNKNAALVQSIAMLAPNYTYSNLVLLGRIFRGGVMGREILKTYASMWAGFEAAYLGLWYGSEQEGDPHIFPWDRKFMTFEISGRTYGLGGFGVSFLRTTSTICAFAAENPDKLIKFDSKTWQDTLGIWEEMFAPATQWVGYRESPAVGFVKAIITGHDATGRRLDEIGGISNEALDMMLPIMVQSMRAEDMPVTPLSVAANVFGLREYPTSASELFGDLAAKFVLTIDPSRLPADLAAKQAAGTLTWNDLGVLQKLFLAENPELAEAKVKADEYRGLYATDDYKRYKERSAEIGAEKEAWFKRAKENLASGKWDIKDYSNNYRDFMIRIGQEWKDLEGELPNLYAAWKKMDEDGDYTAGAFETAYNAYEELMSSCEDTITGEMDYTKFDAGIVNWKATYGESMWGLLKELKQVGFKDNDPLFLKIYQMKQDLDPYYKLVKADGVTPDSKAREAFVKNPANIKVVSELIFLGKISTLPSPDAEAIVRQWCDDYGIPYSSIPALANIDISEEKLKLFPGLVVDDMKKFSALPQDTKTNHSRDYYLLTHPGFMAYYTTPIENGGLGKSDRNPQTGELYYSTEKVLTPEDDKWLTAYYKNTTTEAKQLWRCMYQAGEKALVKAGITESYMYGGKTCKRLLSNPDNSALVDSVTFFSGSPSAENLTVYSQPVKTEKQAIKELEQ